MARPKKIDETTGVEQTEEVINPAKKAKQEYNGLLVEEWSCRTKYNPETQRWEVTKKVEMLRNNIKIDRFTFDRMNARLGQHNNIAYFIQEQQ